MAAGDFPGAVLSLGREAEPIAVGAMGFGDHPPMRPDAIFRIQSMTKIITAVAALRQVERGVLGLDDGVDRWLPELADRRVLRHPDAALTDTEPAAGPITLRHLLTNQSGYGAPITDSPLHAAMIANGSEMSFAPPAIGSQTWLDALTELPLAFQPGTGWRYHHSFAILGILLGRLGESSTEDLLAQDLFGPLGMTDTGFWVPTEKLDRLPAAYRHGSQGPEEVEPAGGGFYAGPPPFDVAYAELVSTAADFRRFLRALIDGELIGAEHLAALRTDQVSESAKTSDSFFPGFWETSGWGFGVSVTSTGRFGWSGGLGTDFFVGPDDTIAILLTQVEMDERSFALLEEFQTLPTTLGGDQ